MVVLRGRAAATWRRTIHAAKVSIAVRPFTRGRLAGADREAVAEAAARYAQFLGLEASLTFTARPGAA